MTIADTRSVALEDRDWYREEPSRAWRDLWSRSRMPTDTRTRRPGDFVRTSGHPRRRVRGGAWLAVGISAAVAAGIWRPDILSALAARPMASPQASPPPRLQQPAPTPIVQQPDAERVVHLAANPGLDAPAKAVTQWTVRDPRFGTVSVIVPIGRTPREALVVALADRGYHVIHR